VFFAVNSRSSSRNVCSFRFVVDRIQFRAMHYAVDNVLMDCVFPCKVKLQKSLTIEKVSKYSSTVTTVHDLSILCHTGYMFCNNVGICERPGIVMLK